MKKAQTNPQSYVALLVFVIGLALIVYILMLPPSDRADLLEQNRTSTSGDKNEYTVLLSREPGTLSNIAEDEIFYDLPGFNLFSKTETELLVDFDSVYVKKSLFEEQQRNISFNIRSPENTANYVLSFTAPRHKGILTIMLNGNILTSDEFSTSPPPIRLPADWLEETNTLVFKVSGPGIEFWNANEYLLKSVKITADITETSGRETKQTFVVTDQEKANLDYFQLSFVVNCKATDVSPLKVYLNKRLLYSTIPECNMPVKVPVVESDKIRAGENDLLFTIETGFFELYNVEYKLKLKKPLYPTYYFPITEDEYAKIKNGEADLNITLLFTNDEDMKKGTIQINGIKREIDTYDQDFNWKVNTYARKGNNAIEIIPRSDKLELLELQVIMAE